MDLHLALVGDGGGAEASHGAGGAASVSQDLAEHASALPLRRGEARVVEEEGCPKPLVSFSRKMRMLFASAVSAAAVSDEKAAASTINTSASLKLF